MLRLLATRWLAVELGAGLLALYLSDLALVLEIRLVAGGSGLVSLLAFASGAVATVSLGPSLRLPAEMWRAQAA